MPDETEGGSEEAEKEEKTEEAPVETTAAAAPVCKVLAVTSCPTGIAHTYMAAEGLEKAAKAKNCTIKVETPAAAVRKMC